AWVQDKRGSSCRVFLGTVTTVVAEGPLGRVWEGMAVPLPIKRPLRAGAPWRPNYGAAANSRIHIPGNSPVAPYDYQDAMNPTCTACRESVSAAFDGEDPGAPRAAVDAHLAGCAGCRGYRDGLAALAPMLAAPRPSPPDLTGAILARIGAEV